MRALLAPTSRARFLSESSSVPGTTQSTNFPPSSATTSVFAMASSGQPSASAANSAPFSLCAYSRASCAIFFCCSTRSACLIDMGRTYHRGLPYAPPRVARRTVALRLLLILGSLLVALLGAELALRLRGLPEEEAASAEQQLERSAHTPLAPTGDRFTLLGLVRPSPVPDIVYELKPSQQGVFKGQPVRINNLGMRGADTSEAKPAARCGSPASATR